MEYSPYWVTRFLELDLTSARLHAGHKGDPQLGTLLGEWATSCLAILQRTFGTDSPYYTNFRQEWDRIYSPAPATSRIGSATPPAPTYDGVALAKLEKCRPIFHAAASDYANEAAANSTTSSDATSAARTILEPILQHFDLAARQLAHRHASRSPLVIEDEHDAQDLLHALLSPFFEDIRSEVAVPGTGGRNLRIDFLLREEQIGIEVKGPDLSSVKAAEQLNDDIAEYSNHPDCKTLLVLVYDPNHRMQNPRGLEHDLNRDGPPMAVKVFVVPR